MLSEEIVILFTINLKSEEHLKHVSSSKGIVLGKESPSLWYPFLQEPFVHEAVRSYPSLTLPDVSTSDINHALHYLVPGNHQTYELAQCEGEISH